jgi:putative Ca2+/H+ antiporter (TMEM165/GDT1 family)
LNLLAVLVGEGLARIVPRNAVLVVAGLLFLLFAWRSWRDGAEEPTEATTIDHRRAWLTSFTLIFVAELGDKTQLAMVALAAKTGALWSVYIGGTLALWTVSLLGILVGHTLLRRIEPRWVHRGAALLFLVFGLLALGQACVGLLASRG